MKALYKENNQELCVKEIPIPVLDENKDLLITVDMAGICRTDVYVANDMIEHKENLVIGHEFTGIVSESKNSKFAIGDRIVFNPIFDDLSMIGVDYDGCFSEYIAIPSKNAVKTKITNKKIAAYVEPIAASLAPLKSKLVNKEMKGAIFGKSRIGLLTYKILKRVGFKNIEIVDYDSNIEDDLFDFMIETELNKDSISFISKKLKKQGILILKSRFPGDLSLNLYDIVRKEITMEGLYYNSFEFAENFAYENEDLFLPLLGETFKLENWKEAFEFDNKGKNKIFLEI